MKEGWKAKKLVDICKIQYGYPFDSKQFCDDSKYPQLIRIRDVSRGYSETYYSGEIPEGYYIDKGDYLIGMDGEFNIAAWNSERALLNQRVCKITANDDAYDRFLYYNLRIILKQIEDETPFVTVKHLSAKRLNTVTINLPSLSEQQHIVEELDLLSSIIEKKKAQLNELDNLAQSLFYEMFGDPITNEKGWEVKLFGEIASFKNGLNYHPMENGLKIKCIGVGDFQDRKELREFVSVKELSIEEYVDEGYFLSDGDIIIVRSNGSKELVGRNMIVYPKEEKITYSGFCIRCRLRTDEITPIVLNRILSSRSTMKVLRQEGRGCNISNINQKILSSLPIMLPPIDLQQQFASKIEAIEHLKELIKQSIKEVETLFNNRMDFYFN